MIDLKKKRFIIFGSSGFLGQNLIEEFKKRDLTYIGLSSNDIDLITESNDYYLFKSIFINKDCIVINLAANCGGIGYNQKNPVNLFTDNMNIIMNVFKICHNNKVEKLINVGTVCSYPITPSIPFKEEEIWDGYPEPTNAPYGIAKKCSLVLSECFKKQYGLNSINLMLANMYGEFDHFGSEKGHVIPDLINKFIEAKNTNSKSVMLWGTGKATRDFLYAKDAVNILLKIIEFDYNKVCPVNIGTGLELSIATLAVMIKNKIGFEGDIWWDGSKPNGQPKRVLDITKLESIIGKYEFTSIYDGINKTIDWYLEKIKGD